MRPAGGYRHSLGGGLMAAHGLGGGRGNGGGGGTGDDDRKSENADDEFHDELTPLQIASDWKFHSSRYQMVAHMTRSKST